MSKTEPVAPAASRRSPKLKKVDQSLQPSSAPHLWLESAQSALGTGDVDLVESRLTQMVGGCRGQGENLVEVNAAIAAITDIEPRDELEAMLAAQMVAIHNLAMEMTKRTLLADQTFDGVNANVSRVTKLMRTFTIQIEALQRYRGGGKQTVTAQHVHVNEGGQAVVGNAAKGGGGNG